MAGQLFKAPKNKKTADPLQECAVYFSVFFDYKQALHKLCNFMYTTCSGKSKAFIGQRILKVVDFKKQIFLFNIDSLHFLKDDMPNRSLSPEKRTAEMHFTLLP